MSNTPEEPGQDNGSEVIDETVALEVEDDSQGGGDSLNPAWNDLLQVVPEMLHSQVTPHLQKWDKNYQEGINKVHSQYSPFKPYLDNNINPDQINYALQLMQAIEQRPAEVIQALQEYANPGQGNQNTGEQGQVGDSEVPEFLQHPEFQRMNQMLTTMAQIMVQQNQVQESSAEDQRLSDELDQLHEELGDYDEQWVLTQAAMNPQAPLRQHVEAYQNWEKNLIAQKRRAPGPKVMGAGGAAPDNQVDTTKLDAKGRRAMITQLLQSAAQNNG